MGDEPITESNIETNVETSEYNDNQVIYQKEITDFKKFMVKYSFISSILIWTLSNHIQNLIKVGIDTFIDPLFAIDIDNNGEPDLERIRKLSLRVFGVHFYYGEFLVELLKTAIITILMYKLIMYLIKYTDIFE